MELTEGVAVTIAARSITGAVEVIVVVAQGAVSMIIGVVPMVAGGGGHFDNGGGGCYSNCRKDNPDCGSYGHW